MERGNSFETKGEHGQTVEYKASFINSQVARQQGVILGPENNKIHIVAIGLDQEGRHTCIIPIKLTEAEIESGYEDLHTLLDKIVIFITENPEITSI